MASMFGAPTAGASDLGFGSTLGQPATGESDEDRKKRLEAERQARLMGSPSAAGATTPGASALGLGYGAGGGLRTGAMG